MREPIVCEVHGEELKPRKIPIMYGYPDFDPAWEVAGELFPHSRSYELGGCLVSPDNPTKITGLICKQCREAEAEWRKANIPDDEVFTY